MKSVQILTINKWATSVLQYPAVAAGSAPRPNAHPVNLSRSGQLTGSSQSQAEDGSTPPNSVVPWELSRFWLWSIRVGIKGGDVCTMPNKSKKDKVGFGIA